MRIRGRLAPFLARGLAGGLILATVACTPAVPTPSDGHGAAIGSTSARSSALDGPPIVMSLVGVRAAASAAPSSSSAPSSSAPSLSSPPPPPIPPNTIVLHIGDSFLLAGFAQALKPRMKSLGARYEVRSEQSSYTTSWAGKMERLVADTQPDLVIINLGANEISNTDPPTHASAVRRIVKAIGGRPCVWVSPPLWRKDTGIIDVIREHSAPCRFFDSDILVTQPIPRIGDKIHPTIGGGAVWAAAFWEWLEAQRDSADRPLTSGAISPDSASTGAHRSPWQLRPSPPEEHHARRAPPAEK